MLHQQILETKGWSIHRIWSTNWFYSRTTEIDRLEKVLKEKLEEDRRLYATLTSYEEEPEVITQVEHVTEQELVEEEQEEQLLLHEALERFWERNIAPFYSDRSRSILSEKMIAVLVEAKPTNSESWYQGIPQELRTNIRPEEGEFRQDVFEIIAEYV